MDLNTPLSDVEWDRLDDFLMQEEGPENAMDISMLHGFLTAVVSGPNVVMPSEWMRWIWDTEGGEDGPIYRDQTQAEEIIGLIMRLYQEINDTLNHAPQDFAPAVTEREVDGRIIPIIDEWCMGYYTGMALDLKAWTPLLLAQPELLSTVLLYGTEEGWESLNLRPISLDDHEVKADGLTDVARQVHAYWLAQRRQLIQAGSVGGLVSKQTTVRRDGAKIGRNDPCHCGSGRKYKHCHGAH